MSEAEPAQQTIFDPMIGVERVPAQEVQSALLREQFERVRQAMVTSVVPIVILTAAHVQSADPIRLMVWVLLMLAVLWLRWINAGHMLVRSMEQAGDHRGQYLREWAGAITVGLAWGSVMWLLGNAQLDGAFYFRLVFLAGVCAIALGITGMAPSIYGSFLATLVLSTVFSVFLDVGWAFSANWLFVGLMMVFFGMLMFRSTGESRQARERIEARLNQALLVQRLRDVVLEQQGIQLTLEAKSADLERSNQMLNQLAIHDALTGAYNRGHVQELLRQSVARFNRYRQPLCVMLIDLDHFKRVNDNYGHAVGDEVLRQISSKAAAVLREGDVFGRWGGEEFIALLPNIDIQGASDVAERLRLGISELKFSAEAKEFGVTVSIGVSQIQDAEGADALVDRADVALYAAKDAGRNCVILSGQTQRSLRAAA